MPFFHVPFVLWVTSYKKPGRHVNSSLATRPSPLHHLGLVLRRSPSRSSVCFLGVLPSPHHLWSILSYAFSMGTLHKRKSDPAGSAEPPLGAPCLHSWVLVLQCWVRDALPLPLSPLPPLSGPSPRALETLLKISLPSGASLVIHWLRLCLPMQGAWVPTWARKLRSHMPWARKLKHKREVILEQIQ